MNVTLSKKARIVLNNRPLANKVLDAVLSNEVKLNNGKSVIATHNKITVEVKQPWRF